MKDILRYNIIVNNRDIVASICINELELLLSKVELVQDRQMLNHLIECSKRQMGSNIPMKLEPVRNLLPTCKEYNYCSTCCRF